MITLRTKEKLRLRTIIPILWVKKLKDLKQCIIPIINRCSLFKRGVCVCLKVWVFHTQVLVLSKHQHFLCFLGSNFYLQGSDSPNTV